MDYKTIAKPVYCQYIVKKSRFISHITPINSLEIALAFIKEISKKHYNATHNVYSFILQDGLSRFSDDGEPQGTAGIPTLNVLTKENLVDVCIVTTRYFGGTLLGGGGLVRAYSTAAKMVIDEACIITMKECVMVSITCEYNFYSKLTNALEKYTNKLENVHYSDVVIVETILLLCDFDSFSKDLIELSNGTVVPSILHSMYYNL